MIDDERPDAPEEQPTPGGDDAAGDVPDPSASADPSESPAAGDDAVEDDAPAAGADPADEPTPEAVAADPTDAPDPAKLAGAMGGDETANTGGVDTGTPTDASAEAAPDAAPDADADAAPAADAPAGDADAAPDAAPADDAPREERPKRDKGRKRDDEEKSEPEVVPGAHLEPDLVLEADRPDGEDDLSRYAAPDDGEPASDGDAPAAEPTDGDAAAEPAARSVLDLSADARYRATGKRKTAVARVILRPGDGGYSINGRSLEDFFPRAALQKAARQPLEVAGFERRMDVVARIHGGGVSAQAGALRHGVARALVEADPALRPELKRRGLLTRDARAKERKKAGLKKARKRPQFSKR
jgi:small subunit ribosomal protein S9